MKKIIIVLLISLILYLLSRISDDRKVAPVFNDQNVTASKLKNKTKKIKETPYSKVKKYVSSPEAQITTKEEKKGPLNIERTIPKKKKYTHLPKTIHRKLIYNLSRFQPKGSSVTISPKESFWVTKGKSKIPVQIITVETIWENGEHFSYKAQVNLKSGKVLHTWDRSKQERQQIRSITPSGTI